MSAALEEKVVLITGASAGIGEALAIALSQQFPGIRLVLAARRAERLAVVAEQCEKAGAEVQVVPTDLAQPEQAIALAEAALQAFGRVDVLVNNAGYGQMGPVELLSHEAMQQQFSVNLIGPIALTRALIPAMRSQGGGRILNISSLGGRLAFPFVGLYSASKFALEGISDVLRMELEPFNIQVSVIEPGPVETEFVAVARKALEQAIAHPLNTPYRAAFQTLENLDKQLANQAWSAERTAAVVINVMRDRHPRPRYIAATGGNLLVFIMTKLMPRRWVDRFWQKFYGIDQVAREWQQSQSASKI